MSTTKKWSPVAVLCGLMVATFLTACGGSTRNEPNPDKGYETDIEGKSSASIEQILTLKVGRPVLLSYLGFGFFDACINGEKKDSSLSGSLDLQPNLETTIHFKALPNSFNPKNLDALKLEVEFTLRAKELFAIDPELDNQPNSLKPTMTVVPPTWQEKINGEATRQESQTVKLHDPDNNAEYKSKGYETGIE